MAVQLVGNRGEHLACNKGKLFPCGGSMSQAGFREGGRGGGEERRRGWEVGRGDGGGGKEEKGVFFFKGPRTGMFRPCA